MELLIVILSANFIFCNVTKLNNHKIKSFSSTLNPKLLNYPPKNDFNPILSQSKCIISSVAIPTKHFRTLKYPSFHRRSKDYGFISNSFIRLKRVEGGNKNLYDLKSDTIGEVRDAKGITGQLSLKGHPCLTVAFRTLVDPVFNIFRVVKRLVNDIIHPLAATKEYYNYANWRMLERFLMSVCHTIATNINSPALSITEKEDSAKLIPTVRNTTGSGKIRSALATLIFKDAFSRVLHFLWFSEIGVGFDNNPKAFRLLGSLLCGIASFSDFMYNLFVSEPKLLLKVFFNSIRQIGILTMSASQGPFYNSFHVKNAATNIGEITAKLEAQNPICDFSGMALGIYLTQFLNGQNLFVKYLSFGAISVFSNVATYMAVKSVNFRNLNPHRCFVVLEDFASALLRRLDRYLRYHKLRIEANRERNAVDDDSSSLSSTSSNSCFDDDECGAIAELIYNYEFDTATKLLHRFTSKHLCSRLRASRNDVKDLNLLENDGYRENKQLNGLNDIESNVNLPGEPLNLVQKKIKIKFLTPDDVAKKEPLLFPGLDGVLRMGAIKYSLNDISVCHATLVEYLKIFKGEKFVVVLGSDGIVEAAIHRSAKPKDAILAILTYNIAEKLWTVVTESTEGDYIDLQFAQIWDVFKRSAVGLKDVLLHLNTRLQERKNKFNTDGEQLKEEKETWKRGIQTVKYAYTMAQACIDEVMLSIEAVNWDVDKFELCSPFKN